MTTKSSSAEEHRQHLTDAEVREYLKSHSDFFERHPDMLDHLHIYHSSGSAVSLVEKQVAVLRERNMDIRKRLNKLTDNARDNDKLYEMTRRLVLALLEARDLDQLSTIFHTSMAEEFGVEYAGLVLFGDPGQATHTCRVEALDTAHIEIGALLKSRSATCGALRREVLQFLFPGADSVGSAAVMPLTNENELGVIAVGSSDAHHYTSDTGTLFLGHIAEVLVRLLPRLQSGDNTGET